MIRPLLMKQVWYCLDECKPSFGLQREGTGLASRIMDRLAAHRVAEDMAFFSSDSRTLQ